jgi:hypothetical protein
MPFRRTQDIYAMLRDMNLPSEAWALFSELHNLQNMHPDLIAAEIRREKDRERKRHTEPVSTDSTETPIYINNNIPGGDRGVGKGEPNQLSTEFEPIWKLYPCKKSKGKAEKAFVAARKIATLAEISAGVDRLLAEKREPKFWPYFASWLNAKGWLDEPSNVVAYQRPAYLETQKTYREQRDKQ